jgi:hypothetical protein
MEEAALNEVGLAFMVEQFAAPHLASGALVRVGRHATHSRV